MKIILFCILFSSCYYHNRNVENYSGSCVIGVLTEKSVTLGGESNLISYSNNILIKAPNYCKVYYNGNVIYGGAGYLRSRPKGIFFDPLKTIQRMKFFSNNLEEKINEIYNNLYDSLLLQASSINTNTPDFNNKLISIVFGSFDNGKPIIGALEIRFLKDSSNITYLTKRIATTTEALTSIAVGETDFYDAYLDSNPNFLQNIDSTVPNAILFLIKEQSKILPKKVNESISLIKVDSTGVSC